MVDPTRIVDPNLLIYIFSVFVSVSIGYIMGYRLGVSVGKREGDFWYKEYKKVKDEIDVIETLKRVDPVIYKIILDYIKGKLSRGDLLKGLNELHKSDIAPIPFSSKSNYERKKDYRGPPLLK